MAKLRIRRLFRFSLRTMLIVVLLTSVWLWRTKVWVEARREFRLHHSTEMYGPLSPAGNAPTAPSPLFWLWKESVEYQILVQSPGFMEKADYHQNHPTKEAEEARALFPEAIIIVDEPSEPVGLLKDPGMNFVPTMYFWHPGEDWNWTPPKANRTGK